MARLLGEHDIELCVRLRSRFYGFQVFYAIAQVSVRI